MTEYAVDGFERQAAFEVTQEDALELLAEHSFANLETYKLLNQRGELARESKVAFIEAVLNGETPESPCFEYPDIEIDDIVAERDKLTDILHQVLKLDMNDEGNRLVREKVTHRIHETGILILAKLQSEMSPDDPSYAAVSYQLGENMRELYGTPEREHWRGILGYRLQLLSEVVDRDDVPSPVLAAWEFIRDRLPSDLPIEQPYRPQPETMAWYKTQLLERLEPARAAVTEAIESAGIILNEDGKLDAENIVKATNIALKARGCGGWVAELTDEANIDTSQVHKRIFIPRGRFMSMAQFDQVIQSHEIDEHVVRRDNGDRSGKAILGGTGCIGATVWEEGNGKANEALLKGRAATEASAFNHFLSVGLALGYDQAECIGRNFGDTFDLVWRMRYVETFLKGKIVDDSVTEQTAIMDKTVDALRRIFRGTDGKVAGVVFPKDGMTYYLGQVQVWRKWDADMKLSEEDRSREHALERSAKIDPLRADHRRVSMAA